jgi:menaquinone reductase, multiheme cytochrome c subunit
MARSALVFGFGVATALAAGWFAFPRALYLRSEQPVAFHHKTHAEKSGTAQCGDCHSFREDGAFGGIPRMEACAACHAERIGTSQAEARLVDGYIKKGRETPWRELYGQPPNVWFSHTIHTRLAKLTCKECHGAYGGANDLPPYERNRVSGYSRKVLDMNGCEECHRQRGVEVSCLGCHE